VCCVARFNTQRTLLHAGVPVRHASVLKHEPDVFSTPLDAWMRVRQQWG
jgi:hypothetical protein